MKYAGAVYEARTHGSVRGMRRARLTLLDVSVRFSLEAFCRLLVIHSSR